MDLKELIDFTAPGATARVVRWQDVKVGELGDGAPVMQTADMWAGIDTWDASAYQDALDALVTWRDGAAIPTGADVHGNIAAFNQSLAAANQEAARMRVLDARVKNLDTGRLLKALVRTGDLPKGNIPPGQLDALQALAEIDGEQPL